MIKIIDFSHLYCCIHSIADKKYSARSLRFSYTKHFIPIKSKLMTKIFSLKFHFLCRIFQIIISRLVLERKLSLNNLLYGKNDFSNALKVKFSSELIPKRRTSLKAFERKAFS